MPRGRPKQPTLFINSLSEAIKFVSYAQRPLGSDPDTHCRIFNQWVCATNSIISVAHPITDDFQICPHTHSLLAALNQCKQPFSITQLSPETIAVKAGEFEAMIPCCAMEKLPAIAPDLPCALIDGRFIAALLVVSSLVSDTAEVTLRAVIQMRGQSVLATDGEVILEAWHGIDLPPGLLLPKSAATALAKCGKNLTKFGYSPTSVTFWFDDGSWLKSQLYVDAALPDVDKFWQTIPIMWPVPKGLFDSLALLAPFSTNGIVHFDGTGAKTDNMETTLGAIVALKGGPKGVAFKLKNLKVIAPFVKEIDFTSNAKAALFFGVGIRGVIAKE